MILCYGYTGLPSDGTVFLCFKNSVMFKNELIDLGNLNISYYINDETSSLYNIGTIKSNYYTQQSLFNIRKISTKNNIDFYDLIKQYDSVYNTHDKYITPSKILYFKNIDIDAVNNNEIESITGANNQYYEFTYLPTVITENKNKQFQTISSYPDVRNQNYDRPLYLRITEKINCIEIIFVRYGDSSYDRENFCAREQGFDVGVLDIPNKCLIPLNCKLEYLDFNKLVIYNNHPYYFQTIRIYLPENCYNIGDILILQQHIDNASSYNGSQYMPLSQIRTLNIKEVSDTVINSEESYYENNLYNYYNEFYNNLIGTTVYNFKINNNRISFKIAPCYNDGYYYRHIKSIVNIYLIYNDKNTINQNDTTILDSTTIIIDNISHFYDYKQNHQIQLQLNDITTIDDYQNKNVIVDVTNIPDIDIENELKYYYHMFHINNYEYNFKFPKLKNGTLDEMYGYYLDETNGEITTIYKPNTNNIMTPIIDVLYIAFDQILLKSFKAKLLCEMQYLTEDNTNIISYYVYYDLQSKDSTLANSIDVTDCTTNLGIYDIQPTKFGFLDIPFGSANYIEGKTQEINTNRLEITPPPNAKKIQQKFHFVSQNVYNSYSNILYYKIIAFYNIKLRKEKIDIINNNFDTIINDINLLKYDAFFRFTK